MSLAPDTLAGLVSTDVGRVLSAYAAAVPPDQAIVELGSYKGKSTCFLAAGAKNGLGARVWAVDAWDLDGNQTGRFGFAEPSTRRMFEQQVRDARLWSRVTPVQAFTTQAAAHWSGPPVGLLFVDADHDAASVRADWQAWKPHLHPQGVVIFDDYRSPRSTGVAEAVDRMTDLEVRVEADWVAVGRLR